MKKFLHYNKPWLDEKEEIEIIDALRSGWISRGPKTSEFEKRFAEYLGVKHAIALNSCTAGLHISLLCADIKPGDEVIVPSFTFCATANTVIHCGAKPIFVDIDPETLCIDANKIEGEITPKTKAIVPVHYAGLSCDMDKITAIAQKYNLFVSEDAAHAIYSTYKGKNIGTISDTTSFSFYATKNLATGEGGMITTNNDEIAEKVRIMSLHGMSRAAWNRYNKGGSWYYEVEYPGFKYNMTDLQAALGLHQLAKLETMQNIRTKYAQMYNEAFKDLPGITIPKQVEGNRHAWHLYTLRINHDILSINRNEFIEKLNELDIGTSVHFIPVHMHPYYRKTFGCNEGDLPVTEKIFNEILSIPLYPGMTEDDVEYIINSIKTIVNKNSRQRVSYE